MIASMENSNMKTISIGFEDFWDGFDAEHNFITEILSQRYNIEVIDVRGLNVLDKMSSSVQYLFYSCFGDNHVFYDCIKIFFTGESVVPDFNACDYAIGFDNIVFGDRYIRYPLYYAFYQRDVLDMLTKNEKSTTEVRNKFCAMVVSNGSYADPIRRDFFVELSKYKQVDSAGRYLNNVGIPDGVTDKQKFLSEYRFSLAFESTSHLGYCTEKIVQAYAAGTIPIYFGDPNICSYFNPKSFVFVDKNNISEAIDRVIQIDQSPQMYEEMKNEVAIIDPSEFPDVYYSKISRWLFYIFDQEYTKAIRRDSFGRSKLMENAARERLLLGKGNSYSVFGRVKNKLKSEAKNCFRKK